MKLFDKLGRLLTKTSLEAEFIDGQPKLRVSDKPIQKALEDIYAELLIHRALLDKKEKIDKLLPDLITKDKRKSQFVVSGFTDTGIVHLDVQGLAAASTAFMLIDLSDTTNWPHVETGHTIIEYIILEIDPADNYLGEIKLGFLENVDASNGDFHQVIDIDMARKSSLLVETLDFGSHGADLRVNHWFGPTTVDSALFQTVGADIVGPDGNSFPSGNGDLVIIVEVSAQSVDVSITVGYETVA